MKRMNPYSHLLLRMTVVLAVVATAAFLNHPGADVKADAGSYPAENVTDDVTPVADIAQITSEVSQDTSPTITPEITSGITPAVTPEITQTAKDDVTDDDLSGEQTPGSGDISETDNTDNEQSGEDPDIPDNYNTDGTEFDDPASVSDDDPDDKPVEQIFDKNSQEYVESLLVTDPDHYNKKVVENAKSIPTDSDNDRYLYITGVDKQIYTVGHMPDGYKNCSEASAKMVTLDVPVWKMTRTGEKYSSYWPITINEKLADSIRCIFSDIYLLDMKFPFNYLVGYTYRKVGGVGLVNSKLMSTHAFGVALDINMGDYDNDYFLGKGNDLRDKSNPYCIPDEVIDIFERYGWFWGGNYDICADTMHFQYYELGFLQYDSDEPFPILSYGASKMDGTVIRNLTQRLVKLGYMSKETSVFTKKVDEAVKKFQEEHGLEADGIVDYETWEPLINLTHYMDFVF